MLRALILAGLAWLTLDSAIAAQYVYPSAGQSAEQQKQDEYECHNWAVQQTGVDPSRPATSTTNSSQGRSVGRTAARGAVLGGVIGSFDGNWGKGAAIGAAAGGLLGAGRNAMDNDRAAEATAAASGEYEKARASCLMGRGYTVN